MHQFVTLTNVRTYVRMHVYNYVCMYVCVYVCMYVCVGMEETQHVEAKANVVMSYRLLNSDSFRS